MTTTTVLESKLDDNDNQNQNQDQKDFTIKINDGVCIKEAKVKHVYKIEHNVWYNRARRRFKKSQYFSDRA